MRVSPKYAISLPDTKAEINRQQKAMKTMMPHDTQLWGEVNSIACDKSMKSDIVGEGDGKGSVSKIIKN